MGRLKLKSIHKVTLTNPLVRMGDEIESSFCYSLSSTDYECSLIVGQWKYYTPDRQWIYHCTYSTS